jgi:hypothetical protein
MLLCQKMAVIKLLFFRELCYEMVSKHLKPGKTLSMQKAGSGLIRL